MHGPTGHVQVERGTRDLNAGKESPGPLFGDAGERLAHVYVEARV